MKTLDPLHSAAKQSTLTKRRKDVPRVDNEVGDWWARPVLEGKCLAPAILKTQEYSRGNNDLDQMKYQHDSVAALAILLNSGLGVYVKPWVIAAIRRGTWQYETVRFYLNYLVDPKECTCTATGDCSGEITISVHMAIVFKTVFPGGADGYVMLCGPDAKKETVEIQAPGHPPRSVKVQIDKVDLPAAVAKNNFTQPNPAKPTWIADASCTMSCTPGKYLKRFYIVRQGMAGQKNVIPGEDYLPIVFIDCIVDVTKTMDCVLDIKLHAFLTEFRPGYDFTHGGRAPGADKELPKIDYTTNEPPRVQIQGATSNIAKLIEEDGVGVDHPFLPKAPGGP
jgi:hypothetical protein